MFLVIYSMYHMHLSFPLLVVQNYAIHINFMHAALANFKIVLNTPKICTQIQVPKKYQIFLPQNKMNKNKTPRKYFDHSHLTLEYPPVSFLR